MEEKTVTEEKKTGAEKPEEKTGVPPKWQMWFYLFMTAVSVINVVAGLIPLIRLFDGLRLFSVILWAVAGIFFGAASYFAWKAGEKAPKEDRRA